MSESFPKQTPYENSLTQANKTYAMTNRAERTRLGEAEELLRPLLPHFDAIVEARSVVSTEAVKATDVITESLKLDAIAREEQFAVVRNNTARRNAEAIVPIADDATDKEREDLMATREQIARLLALDDKGFTSLAEEWGAGQRIAYSREMKDVHSEAAREDRQRSRQARRDERADRRAAKAAEQAAKHTVATVEDDMAANRRILQSLRSSEGPLLKSPSEYADERAASSESKNKLKRVRGALRIGGAALRDSLRRPEPLPTPSLEQDIATARRINVRIATASDGEFPIFFGKKPAGEKEPARPTIRQMNALQAQRTMRGGFRRFGRIRQAVSG